MNTFHYNIISIYGEKGKEWLKALPELVSVTSSKLDLRDLQEVTNLTYNYVLSGFQGDNPIILKASLDSEGLAREAFALRCFEGCGAVKVISEDDLPDQALAKAGGMLLLQRAVPSTSLKSYFPDKEHESIKIAYRVMQKLHQANIPATHNFPHIKDWLKALDKDWPIPDGYLQKARKLRDELLQTSKPDVLLHGDLHHDNILQNGEDWLVIDPKGVIGEPAYEMAAFIRNPMPELLTYADASNIIFNRVNRFAAALELPEPRIIDWCFVQAVLAWVWALEDGCDASYFEQITKFFNKLS